MSGVEGLCSAVGEAAIREVVASFYRRVPGDEVLGPMYPAADMAGAEKRLADFLVYRFGGPETYLEERGHPRLRQRHAPFALDEAAEQRWLALMNAALDEAGWPTESDTAVRAFFTEVARFLRNR